MQRLFQILPILLLFCLVGRTVQADSIDRYIETQLKKRHIPGLSLAVVRDGKVIKAKGYGFANLELRAHATPATVYQVGSVSKQFAASAIMLLVQEGKVGLDDKLSKYLPSAPDSWKEITLRHLLTHTSGLPREGQRPTKGERADYTDAELVQSASALLLLSPPGEKYSYSNVGFNLLGMVVAKASGQNYADFLQKRFFKPLGMTATRVNDPIAFLPNRASAYQWAGGAFYGSDFVSPTWYAGAGAIVSTVLDLAKWDAALNTEFPLTEASRKQMWTPMTLKNGKPSDYGFGWRLSPYKGHADIHHDGIVNGFHSEIDRFVDDHLTVIVLVNLIGLSNPERIAHTV
ncbi:MAG: penicillin-binding protein, partial [Chthonomonadales bacterium]|nr:penicillin-binding protein [Chthonomonadales bacterium]